MYVVTVETPERVTEIVSVNDRQIFTREEATAHARDFTNHFSESTYRVHRLATVRS